MNELNLRQSLTSFLHWDHLSKIFSLLIWHNNTKSRNKCTLNRDDNFLEPFFRNWISSYSFSVHQIFFSWRWWWEWYFLQSGEEPCNLLFHNKWILESTLLTLALVYSRLPRFGHEWTKFRTVIIFITSLRSVLKNILLNILG